MSMVVPGHLVLSSLQQQATHSPRRKPCWRQHGCANVTWVELGTESCHTVAPEAS
jgi:hypothetical protein